MREEAGDRLKERLKDSGLRLTPQRTAIFRAVQASRAHPNADAVFRVVRKKYPSMSFDTVNRTLGTFAEIGLLNVVEGYGEPRRYDPNTGKHHHFRCLKCGVITDFVNEAYNDLEILKPSGRNLRYSE